MYKRWTQEEIEQLKSCASAGMTMKQAAEAIGCSRATLRYKASTLQVSFNGKSNGGAPRKSNWERAKKLAADGCWMSKAARILNVHHTTALYISRQMGFKWPPAPPLTTWYVPKPHVHVKPKPKYDPREDHEDAARIERMLEIAGRCA